MRSREEIEKASEDDATEDNWYWNKLIRALALNLEALLDIRDLLQDIRRVHCADIVQVGNVTTYYDWDGGTVKKIVHPEPTTGDPLPPKTEVIS